MKHWKWKDGQWKHDQKFCANPGWSIAKIRSLRAMYPNSLNIWDEMLELAKVHGGVPYGAVCYSTFQSHKCMRPLEHDGPHECIIDGYEVTWTEPSHHKLRYTITVDATATGKLPLDELLEAEQAAIVHHGDNASAAKVILDDPDAVTTITVEGIE